MSELKLNNKRTILVGLAFLSICSFWHCVYFSMVDDSPYRFSTANSPGYWMVGWSFFFPYWFTSGLSVRPRR